MFNRDFYPTPPDVIELMTEGLNIDGSVILEPQAGKGDIVDYLKQQHAEVIACELNDDLRKIVDSKCSVIARDFLTVEASDISHINAIVMNPPFSADEKHILHAYKIAPAGCQIRALCNLATLENPHTILRKRLASIVRDEGEHENLGTCFDDAERKTGVEVALIKISKPAKDETDWSEYFEYEELDESHEDGVMKHDVITEIVGRYVGSLKMFQKVDDISSEINTMMSPINTSYISFGCTYKDDRRETCHLNFEEFKVRLQMSAWKTVFDKMKMGKYMTESLKEKINKFVEEQSKVPFTRRNIYNMLQFVHDTNSDRMDEVLLEVFDMITKHYDENRYHVEGWKTNAHYMVNQKIILPYMVQKKFGDDGSRGIDMDYRNARKIDDFTKALCFVTGRKYEEIGDLDNWLSRTPITDPDYYRNNEIIRSRAEKEYDHYAGHYSFGEKFLAKNPDKEEFVQDAIEKAIKKKEHNQKREFGKWYEWGFFEIKGFKKGTMHLKFKDDKVWELFNQKIAQIKGYPLYEHTAA